MLPGPAKRIFTAIFLILIAAPLLSQTQPRRKSRLSFLTEVKKGAAATFRYKKLEVVKDEYVILEGDETESASIKYQDITVSAQKITYNQKTQEVIAEGHVIIDQGVQRLSADHASYNLDSKTGVLSNAKGSFEPSIYFSGEKIEKIDQDTYRLTNGVLTSCDIEDPDWSFRVGSGLVTVDAYARLRNIVFFADRLPVLYTPYIVWPTKRDRAQGFLIPRVGNRGEFGRYIENSYFIPLGQSMDATLRADFYTSGAMQGGTIFRYVPTVDVRGEFEGYLVRDPDRGKLEWRYGYKHTHEDLPGGFRAVIDLRDFSNLDFFKGFERDFDIRTLSNIYSSAFLTKNRPKYSLNIRADRREHFLPSLEVFARSVVFEQFPSIQYSTYPMQIGRSPLYFSLESSAGQLRRKERQLGAFTSSEYLRGDFFPTLSMQLKTPLWFSVKPQLSLRETYYGSSLDLTTRKIVDEPLSRRYGQAQVEVVGPSLSRIYNTQIREFVRFKHVIEPRIRYFYTTEVNDQQRVIQFDTVDSPFVPLNRQTVEYSLTQRLLAKQKGENTSAREVMSVTLRQSAALDDPVQAFGQPHRFSPLGLNVRVNPYQTLTFDANANFGNVSHQLDQLNISANLSSKDRYVNFTWFASFLQPGQTVGNSSQFRISTGSPLWRDRLRADIHLNYDAERRQFLERSFRARYNGSCFSLGVERRQFLGLRGFGLPDQDTDLVLIIELKNVGSFPVPF